VSVHCDQDFAAAREYVLQMPVTTFQHMGYVSYYLSLAGDHEGAIEVLLEARETLGEQPTVRLWIENRLTWLYRLTAQNSLADTALQNAIDMVVAIENPGATALVEFASTAALRGDAEETLALGRRLFASLPEDAYRYPDFAISMAIYYASVGLIDEALDLVEETSAAYTFEQELIFEHMPSLEPLRDNPRFKTVVENVEVY